MQSSCRRHVADGAAHGDITPMLVMAYLDEQKLPMKLTLVHPV